MLFDLKCYGYFTNIMMRFVYSSLLILALSIFLKINANICSDKCSSDQCCEIYPSVGICCPFDKATCCENGLWCCPDGSKCDSDGFCVNLLSFERFPASALPRKTFPKDFWVPFILNNFGNKNSFGKIYCPSEGIDCPDGSTCCTTSLGNFSCCTYANATCCSNGGHCCPQGYTCDESSSSCIKQSSLVILIKSSVSVSGCPGNEPNCPSTSTCCLTRQGYGCCHMKNADCCSDGIHCCPEGSRCSAESTSCESLSKRNPFSAPWIHRQPTPDKISFACPNPHYHCPSDNFTCCHSIDGSYNCCPITEAVCCADGRHCCPAGTSCDLEAGGCVHRTDQGRSATLPLASTSQRRATGAVTSLDRVSSSCPHNSTSCRSEDDSWACCPLPGATCCWDGQHCCPQHYDCEKTRCRRRDESPDSGRAIALAPSSVTQFRDRACPDNSTCPDYNTCCPFLYKGYGCCPMEDATCCADKLHCCPHGYECLTDSCKKKAIELPTLSLSPLVVKATVVCPDNRTCRYNSTCCKRRDGSYGCCPLPSAVCCSDGYHCCPHNRVCNPLKKRCDYPPHQNPFEKILTIVDSSDDVSSHGSCHNGQVLCSPPSGQSVCCPKSEPLCCQDEEMSEHRMPSLMTASLEMYPERLSMKCPDHKSYCSSDQTCCLDTSGHYGCCPYKNAVCCSDGYHCCPHNRVCNLVKKTCDKPPHQNPFEKILTIVDSSADASSHGSCHNGQVLCSPPSGQSVCCPKSEPLCCRTGDKDLWPVFPKEPSSTQIPPTCPDGSRCQENSTCCLISDLDYGCCPIENAVCCPDRIHCCPHGRVCNKYSSTCDLPTVFPLPWLPDPSIHPKQPGCSCQDHEICCTHHDSQLCCPEKDPHCCVLEMTSPTLKVAMPNKTSTSLKHILCPEGSICSDNSTCCQISKDTYGCCPLQNAVCCIGSEHCCPFDYECKPDGCYRANIKVMDKISAKEEQRTFSNDRANV